MTKVTMTASFRSTIDTVWAVVTNTDDVSWRSDLRSVATSADGTVFVEVSKSGSKTQFRVIEQVEKVRYCLKMHNDNLNGTFWGEFYTDGDGTKIVFTEEVEGMNPLVNLGAKRFIEKHQKAYVADLRRALGE